jgi:hypothetical protein
LQINIQPQNVEEIEMVNFEENFYDVEDDFARRLSDEYNVSLTKFYKEEKQFLK